MPLPDLAAAPGPALDLDLALASLGGETLRGEGAPPALPFFPLEEEEGAAVAAAVAPASKSLSPESSPESEACASLEEEEEREGAF